MLLPVSDFKTKKVRAALKSVLKGLKLALKLPRNMTNAVQLSLFLPDRFDVLERRAKKHDLRSIVVAVPDSLSYIDDLYSDMDSAGRGAFLVFRGESGSGKSTFLHTLYLFKEDVKTYSILQEKTVADSLKEFGRANESLRVLVVEGREALTDFSEEILEKELHAINTFIRSASGEKTLIVWTCNTDDLQSRLITLAGRIGAESLLGVGEGSYRFSGPPKNLYLQIANKTLEALNEGASLIDLGIAEEQASELVKRVNTIGTYLALLRQEIRQSQSITKSLLDKEQCRVWTVVIAGNDPEKDTAALTRGSLFSADISCLMSSTEANIVEEIKTFPDKIGVLATILDAKILHLPVLSALAIAKQYADTELRLKMKENSMALSADPKVLQRLNDSEVAKALKAQGRGIGRRGKPIGSNTVAAFDKLASIAREQDGLLNKAVGEALQKNGLIHSFETEVDFTGHGLNFKSDLVCQTETGPIRLEMMWRKTTSRAEISNYVLTKLYNYGRAIGLLQANQS
ncbi:hypothetical protein NDA01_13590 [Trichocoleus desertorum AS-A10]|uniref:hypothetical protein n=1 Tax=Trichocoleus desertorum TaxID=1481672 RepID=UPI0032987DB6